MKIEPEPDGYQKKSTVDPVKKTRISKGWKLVIQGLPLAAAGAATFMPLHRLGQQFIMLFVLLWLQVFFIIECLLAGQ
jgi:hypothetical protein